ncbi:fatty acyl-CoA reductase wat-like [Leptopilina boulardi]|uniref:fatty acyl-CoA reductase wat-like n=1 Tax=Leptopilina boulardi TaxID=63433 RepID=UPI0021F50D9E|nr:fatty acyl-CoA reductase wat-like [Leptopilina boulardi]
MSEIQQFFEEHTLFITGGTGFIGKILVEKFLRGLPKIKKIYLLIREKKGKNIQERFENYFNADLFHVLKEKNPSAINKVIPISGDVMKPGLGLSDIDRKTLINEVSIVVHSAATTRFDEPLNIAVSINVESVLEIIKLCRELKNLKVAVHVSTAFIQSNLKIIEEKVYPMPMTYEEAKNTIQIIKRRNLSKENEKRFTKILLQDYPNTYVFTKSMAEGIISETASDLPFCIYRFPVALGTYKEPFAGWIDVAQGFNQFLVWLSMGYIRVIIVPDRKDVLYIVPADFACNALIASIWDASNKINRSSSTTLPVYNYVNNEKNQITKGIFEKVLLEHGPKYLPSTAVYFPDATLVKSKRTFNILSFFVHLLPALIGDIILKILGEKPVLNKFYKKGLKLSKSLEFFMETKWYFENKNIQATWKKLSKDDKTLFPFDMETVDWSHVLIEMWKGVLKYVIKDDIGPKSEKRNLRRYYKLMVIHRTLQAIFFISIIWLTWKIFF